jgi:hypothetical protein
LYRLLKLIHPDLKRLGVSNKVFLRDLQHIGVSLRLGLF